MLSSRRLTRHDESCSTSPVSRAFEKIRIRGFDFTIIGMQEKLGSTGGQSQDNQVYMPVTVFTRRRK